METNSDDVSPRVLLVDDDQELLDMLGDYLGSDGFSVTCAYGGATGLQFALSGRFDIAVLDVSMPGMDGFDFLARLRVISTMPVLMLSARGDDTDRITGLEIGADDYVPKPCTPRELAARLRAILKRVGGMALRGGGVGGPLVIGSLSIWPAMRRAEENGRLLNLTSTEFSLLETLMHHAGRPVSKAVLSEQALGRPLNRFDRSIDVHIHGIRNKLTPMRDGRSRIQTVIRKGYVLLVEPGETGQG